MEQHRVNQLPVLVDGRLVGIVTDRDLRDAYPSVFESSQHRSLHRSDGTAQLDHIPVEAVMTPHVVTLCPSDTLIEAARLMRRERIGAVPVVDGERVVGIITRSDLLDALVSFIDEN